MLARIAPVKNKAVRYALIGACVLLLLGVAAVGVINGVVCGTTADAILSTEQALLMSDVDYIIVLGAGVKADGTPSDMLYDRVLTGAELALGGASGQLLMSGDNQSPDYDEVSAMVTLAEALGVPTERIATDRLGLSTYESVSRAKRNLGAERVIIVTQSYHLYRALYIAEQLGIEAYGVSADVRSYRGQILRDVREWVARCKDFAIVHLK